MMQNSITMDGFVSAIVLAVFALIFYEIYLRTRPSYRAAAQFPGSKVFPIVQNIFTVLFMSQTRAFANARKLAKAYNNQSYRTLVAGILIVEATHHKDVELLLSSSRLITKSPFYRLTYPFIGIGLLNSTGEKWHQRRKILTPTFHFNILKGFLQIFHEECRRLVVKLEEDAAQGCTTVLQKLFSTVTLNTICETAMGIKLDMSEKSEVYKSNIQDVGKIIQLQMMNPLLHVGWIFKMIGYKSKFDKILQPIHAFTKSIIQHRRDAFHAFGSEVDSLSEENVHMNVKQRYAMLDSLLLAEAQQRIDAKGIREEVDTFTFEGHDTTASALVFLFLVIANENTVQERLYEEIQSRPNPTMQSYSDLKYMDRVIKESLRIYPPVPFISRLVTEDVQCNGKVIPKGSFMNVHIYDLHRDPEQFSYPERFDPDRFLPESVQRRNPYAYVPFSAGLRNCIGE
ncbi:probable cytochrome P450 4ac1 [Armigeres subalbatus]|uniref:probable cytochrome P450 4ac1 n=1 Tax=Armigeres subalbatus TaxID=124917 RepID=UPI002ED2BA31